MSTVSSTVVHVNAQKGIPQILIQENCEPLHAVTCHPKRPAVVTGNQKGILKVWDYNRKLTISSRAFETEKQIQCVMFDPQGEPISLHLDTVSKKQHIYLLFLQQTNLDSWVKRFTQLLHEFGICHYIMQCKEPPFCISTGLYLAVGFSCGDVHILNPKTLQSHPEECFHYTKDAIHHITFSSDSKYLATAVSKF